jgi:signal transduction histidine kinase
MHSIIDALTFLFNWFSGNGNYMLLTHCMGHDTFWIVATVALCLSNAAGYTLIAIHWWRNARFLPRVPAKGALDNIRNIFVFCGICGYLFIPIKMVWPAWRLYDIVLAVLVFFTWKYALKARELKVVYSAIGQTTQLQKDLEQSLAESRKKSLFLNAISHDLRTPLNGLALQAHLAEMNLEDPAALKESLAEMRGSISAAASLLDGLLEFARLDWSEGKNHVSQFDLRELIHEAMAPSSAAAEEKGLELVGNCPAGLQISTDRMKLERIMSNLVSNAVKFTKTGSVRVQVQHSDTGTEIHVIDTGIGISREDQKTLFQEFYQIHNHERDRKKGFGLGLAISRRLAVQIGGELSVESQPGAGSRFTLVVPAESPAVVRAERAIDGNQRDEKQPVAVAG